MASVESNCALKKSQKSEKIFYILQLVELMKQNTEAFCEAASIWLKFGHLKNLSFFNSRKFFFCPQKTKQAEILFTSAQL